MMARQDLYVSDDIHLIATQSACRELLARYVLILDLKDWDKLNSIFANNAVFKRTDMAALDGWLQIQGYFEALETKRANAGENHLTCHLLTTISIDVVGIGSATGIAYVLVFRNRMHAEGRPSVLPIKPELMIEYHDQFAQTDIGWRIVVHEARHIFRSTCFRQPFDTDEQARVLAGIHARSLGSV
jgi:hypothetical protein